MVTLFSLTVCHCVIRGRDPTHLFLIYRTLAEWTRSLDPTRPVAFVTDQKGGDDVAVSVISCSHIICTENYN